MHREATADRRHWKQEHIECDLAVVGGGLAGTCCAITAARAGLRVAILQDRPILGGNASSEVRVWVSGACSHMGNNNRWAREGGVIDELLVENVFRNREGNPVLFDALLLEKVAAEPNIRLLLNTAVFDASKKDAGWIDSVLGFCSQNATLYEVRAPLFCDASGDGVLGFLAGAAFRIGSESRDEFGERLAPEHANHELLGHTIFFYTKDVGKPVRFVPPRYALADIQEIPRYHHISGNSHGCELWWIEYGGRLDTIHDAETIKWELWKIVYGVWNHIKNSGKFPEAETKTLEWVGLVPGKRESRRFEGDYILTQQDIVEQRVHPDDVSYGGWAIDLHPSDGVYSELPGCSQWHPKGVYPIPYRCFHSANIRNLFLAGRIVSASHVAFGSLRVMGTCAHAAQAVGMAAALCRRENLSPADLAQPERIRRLQQLLLRCGQYIPGLTRIDPDDLAQQARPSASSRLRLKQLPDDGPKISLKYSRAMLFPVGAGAMPRVGFVVDADRPTTIEVQLRTSSRPGNFTPDVVLAARRVRLLAGDHQSVSVSFDHCFERPGYAFVCLMQNEHAAVHGSNQRMTGVLSLTHRRNGAVATSHTQQAPAQSGVDSFEFWLPSRRPDGHNLAVQFDPPLDAFGPESVINGLSRPTADGPNAWLAALDDPSPTLSLRWNQPQTIRRIELVFDTDFDNPMESSQWQHAESVSPFCVREYRIVDGSGQLVTQCRDNHQTRNTIVLPQAVVTARLDVELTAPSASLPAALLEIQCYSTEAPP